MGIFPVSETVFQPAPANWDVPCHEDLSRAAKRDFNQR